MAVPSPVPDDSAPSLALLPGKLPEALTRRRLPWWWALVLLLLVAQSLLVWLTLGFEASRSKERVEMAAASTTTALKHRMADNAERIDALASAATQGQEAWRREALILLNSQHEVIRIERRDASLRLIDQLDSPFHSRMSGEAGRDTLDAQTELACAAARQSPGIVAYTRSHFVPLSAGRGVEASDLCLALSPEHGVSNYLVASVSLKALLAAVEDPALSRSHELSFVQADGTRLARSGVARGTGAFVAERVIDVPGLSLQLRVDSVEGPPSLIPNLSVALVLGLSLSLFGVVLVLARDVRRRSAAEAALAESLAFRKAMEDSVPTGLWACDLSGRVLYVNQAFCATVGYTAEELTGHDQRSYRPDGHGHANAKGLETHLLHKEGHAIPVALYEVPLQDGSGRQTGWMGAVADLSAQRQTEEQLRLHQERLQVTARMATMGEMASLLSHELNQPLSAIDSFATASQNLLAIQPPPSGLEADLQRALKHISEQAERAGNVMRSVHTLARRREPAREPVDPQRLIEGILPLIQLQARRFGAAVEVTCADGVRAVLCDRTMLEQVLLNLSRNALQAMEHNPPDRARLLRIQVQPGADKRVGFEVSDQGTGIDMATARQLFTPFFTTRPDGMGMGLSMCRTMVEQHGGHLAHHNLQGASGHPVGARFTFTLPAAPPPGTTP